MDEIKELQTLATTKGVYNSFPDQTARKDLKAKLNAPDSVKAGDYLRVQSIGADGTVVLEGAEGTGNGSGQNAVQSSWAQNDPEAPDYVKGRTHWEEGNQTVIEWDGSMDTTGSDYFEYGRSTFAKISDIAPGVSELDSAIISMTADGNTQSFVVKDAYGDSSNWWLVQNKVIDFGGMVLIVHDTDIEEGVTETAIPSTGTYFNLNMLNQFNAERLLLTYGSTIVHPLDEKFIPESIARKADIRKLDDSLTNVQTILRNMMMIIRAQVEDGAGTPQAYSMDISGLAAECDALIAGLAGSGSEVPEEPEQPAKTLVSISATYSGGEVVVGTALTELVGITVTATYSDGTTAVVTGYTLSGEIAEGSNAITVSYGGKTATVTVVGVASGDEEPAGMVGVFCPPMCKIGDWNNLVWPDAGNEFTYTSNVDGTQSVYEAAGLPSVSFMRDWQLREPVWIRILTNEQYGVVPNCFSVYANADGTVETGGFEQVPATIYRQFSGKSQTMDVNGKTYYFMLFKFDIPVGMVGRLLSTQEAMKRGHFISADLTGIDDAYKPYYTMFDFDPSDRITEPATEVA